MAVARQGRLWHGWAWHGMGMAGRAWLGTGVAWHGMGTADCAWHGHAMAWAGHGQGRAGHAMAWQPRCLWHMRLACCVPLPGAMKPIGPTARVAHAGTLGLPTRHAPPSLLPCAASHAAWRRRSCGCLSRPSWRRPAARAAPRGAWPPRWRQGSARCRGPAWWCMAATCATPAPQVGGRWVGQAVGLHPKHAAPGQPRTMFIVLA